MEPSRSRRWLIQYALTLVALTGLAAFAALRLPSYRDPPLDFGAMAAEDYFSTAGMTRRQSGGVKLGYAETHAPPAVGVFGNHIVSFFGAEAFDGPETPPPSFFNYSYANLSLPETLQLLRHLEARGRLPTELMIVSITPPNADNGHFIIDYGKELPPDVALGDALRNPGAPAGLAGALWRTLEIRLHELFNYNTLVLGLLHREDRPHLIEPGICASDEGVPAAAWFEAAPWAIRSTLRPYLFPDPCVRARALRRDGSQNPPEQHRPIRDEDRLDDESRGLRAGDERAIAANLAAIDALGRRNGLSVVFLVTPVFESERSDSVVNQVFDRALALAPELAVIDDREMHDDPALVFDYLHPTPAYYRRVAEEIRRRGLLESAAPPPSPGADERR